MVEERSETVTLFFLPLSSASSDCCQGGEEGEEGEDEMKAEVKAEKISSRAKLGWAEG